MSRPEFGRVVLIESGRRFMTATYQQGNPEFEEANYWVEEGPDGYTHSDSEVVRWSELPEGWN